MGPRAWTALRVLTAVAALLQVSLDGAWAGHKAVLVIYATRPDSEIAVVGERELPRVLSEGLGGDLDYYSEYVDASRFPDPTYQQALRDFLRVKYAKTQVDVVITMQELAFELLSRNRAELFPATPVVYFSSSPEFRRLPNTTGVFAPLELSGTLELALTLQPGLEHAFVVIGASSGDTSYYAAARRQFAPFTSRLDVSYLVGLPPPDLEAQLASLPPDSMVYYVVIGRDAAGRNVHPLQYLERITAVSNAPVYSWVQSAMGRGIVGGRLKSQSRQVEAIGKQALRVLGGEPADAVPIAQPELDVTEVDWRVLRRWGIHDSRVPVGTVMRFREPTAWERYRSYILATGAVVTLQSVLIVMLLAQASRRRRVEARLRAQEAALRESHGRLRDVGSRLLNAQEVERARLARELHDDVSQQVALLEIDLTLLRDTVLRGNEPLADEAILRTQSVARTVHDLSHRLHPARLRLIGLVSAIDSLRHDLSRADCEIQFHHQAVPPLADDVTLCVFRVAQEALQNALKYSGARHILVDLRGTSGGVVLSVVDDGVGFDVRAAWGKGLGLISMAERLEPLGGALEVRSAPGEGARVEAVVPVQDAATAEPPAFLGANADRSA